MTRQAIGTASFDVLPFPCVATTPFNYNKTRRIMPGDLPLAWDLNLIKIPLTTPRRSLDFVTVEEVESPIFWL